MKRILEILAFMPLMLLLNSCEGTEPDSNSAAGSQPGGEVELPQPPEQEKTSNVFVVDIFSTLEDDGDFFGIRSIDSAAQHISNQSGKKPLVYMFDRADFTVGQSHPFNRLSYNINIYQLFAQQEAPDVRKGNRAYNSENYTEAEVNYHRALDKNEQSFEAHFNLGDALFRQEKYPEA